MNSIKKIEAVQDTVINKNNNSSADEVMESTILLDGHQNNLPADFTLKGKEIKQLWDLWLMKSPCYNPLYTYQTNHLSKNEQSLFSRGKAVMYLLCQQVCPQPGKDSKTYNYDILSKKSITDLDKLFMNAVEKVTGDSHRVHNIKMATFHRKYVPSKNKQLSI